jgi:Condensation domain
LAGVRVLATAYIMTLPENQSDQFAQLTKRSIPQRSSPGPWPVSFGQERLWFLRQLEPENSAYNQPKTIRLKGFLQIEALKAALNAIVDRHEVLRTTFLAVDGQPLQMVGNGSSVELPMIDLIGMSAGSREDALKDVILDITQRPFNLCQDLMLRTALVRLSSDEHVLILVMHHIASDGWSTGVLFREIATLYEAFSANRTSPLPDLPIQYADFAIWQREWLQGEVLDRLLSYWKKQLDGIPRVLNLPTDRPKSVLASHREARQSFVLSKDLTEQLRALSRKESVTLYMTLLAALKALLYKYTGQDDLVIGSPIAGRNRPEVEGLIGFFVNTLVLRSNLSGNPSFRELLSRVREVCLGAYAHQELPYQKLVEALQPKRGGSRGSLAQVFFAFQNVPRQPPKLPGLTVTPVSTSPGSAKVDLTLFMWEAEECLAGSLNYAADLFNAATISRMSEYFQTLLSAVVADPERPLVDMPPFIERSRSELIEAIHWATEQSWHFETDTAAGREQGEI